MPESLSYLPFSSFQMGFATTDEMCLAFLYYYPEIKISYCISHPNMSAINMSKE